jgi:Second Messenger Oligonucleotide or Dinucleotide Synthetase domain
MGGTGSGGVFRLDPGEAAKRRQEAEKAARIGQIDAEVNAILSKRLIEINRRDNEGVSSRLDEIQAALSHQIEGVDRLLFGGSVAKQTYVEGMSDIDSLVILSTQDYADLTPAGVIEKFQQALEAKLNRGEAIDIRSGDLAVTIEYDDGLEVQLLPAVERAKKLSITGPSGNSWVAIDPEAFARRLTAVNKSQAGAVVPAIKLAKSILASEPDTRRPDGYHLEALAVAAFEHYSGPRNPKAMLTHLFDSAAKNVKRPVPDVTGQSRQVDANLGGENSVNRRRMSEGLRIIARRMKNAPNIEAWHALLGED